MPPSTPAMAEAPSMENLGRAALRSSLDADEARWQDANSRLLAVVGASALKRLQAARVLVLGMSGLGLEIAKNLALMGARLIAVHDDSSVVWSDLSSNFYLSPDQLGKPRAASVFEKLRELNPRIELKLLTGTVTEAVLEQYTVVVSTDQGQAQVMQISEFCHARNIQFILTRTWGLYGFIFNDFGKQFECNDTSGEPERTQFIGFISPDGIISCNEGKLHDLEDGVMVKISGVQGMTDLNNREFKVTVKDPKKFSIFAPGEFGHLPAYESGGVWVEVKKPKHMDFKSWRESTAALPPNSDIHTLDWREPQIPSYYYTMRALFEFEAQHHHRPYAGSASDAAAVLALAKSLAGAKEAEAISSQFVETVTRQAAGNLNAMATLFGGMVAQEAMKASSGKFSPLKQFLFFDALEALPDSPLAPEEVAPASSRYDGQIAVFGRKICDDIHNARFFLVGSGALGCEMLKNWAMIGVGTGPKGMVTVTDMDAIELSNLNRQFLFREKHLKSQVAAQAAKEMNPEMHLQAWVTRVAPETENVYNHVFWDELTGVCNALDNVKARQYVDGRCVVFRKPLLESGTLGPKGNTQVIVPDLTESYSDSVDPPETGLAACLVHTFPQLIQHTLQWAREKFEEHFVVQPETCVNYIGKDNYIASLPPIDREKSMKTVVNMLVHRQRTFDECIHWARHFFDSLFDLDIQQMLHFFPPDTKDAETGLLFWLPPKRPPVPAKFDPNNPTHVGFVTAATFLRAWNLALIPDELRPKDYRERKAHIRDVAAAMGPSKFVPKDSGKDAIKINEKPEEKKEVPIDEDAVNQLQAHLPERSQVQNLKIHVVEFEKDDDRNFHIDFIHFASTIRAEQYKIAPVDRLQSKLIAGRIIPAIVTTTAAVTGLVCLEFYKLMQGKRKVDSYRNSFINLALPLVSQSEPLPPKKAKCGKIVWTKWDRVEFKCTKNEDLTLGAIIDKMEQTYSCKVESFSTLDNKLVYAGWKPDAAGARKEPLIELLPKRNVANPLSFRPLYLVPLVSVPGEDDPDVPSILVWWS